MKSTDATLKQAWVNRTLSVLQRTSHSPSLVELNRLPNPLRWATVFMECWEILIYDRDGYWEACFFKWGEHHEHVTAESFADARCKAEDRILLLEYGETEH